LGHKIEVFTAGCHLCEETLKAVREAVCEECTIIEYNIREKCESEICLEKAREYGIKAVPTVVIDGKIVLQGRQTVQQIKEALGR
jgi:alkyl hydroperoxide reductase subunit AhpF